MNKAKKFNVAIIALILAVVIAFSFVLVKISLKGSNTPPNLDIGGITNPSDQDNSEEYLALIYQYSKQVNELKSQIAAIKSDRDKQLAEKNAEIASLEEELANSQNQDADIIAAKNARITALKETIKTLEEETAEAVDSYEARIDALNESLSAYESEVIRTISLPANFKFTSLGFNIVDNNNFVFYSRSHSCNLYYYNYETKKTTMLPIKGSTFDSFYKNTNLLFFRAGTSMYSYNFETASLKLLATVGSNAVFVSDANNVYIFDYFGGYGVYKIANGEFQNNFSLNNVESYNEFTALICDNYILHKASSKTPTSGTSTVNNLRLYNTATGQECYLADNILNIRLFTKFNNQYLFVCDSGFYSLNITNNTITQIKNYSTTFCFSYELDGKLVFRAACGLFVYDGQTVTTLTTSSSSYSIYMFLKIQDGVYYVSSNESQTQYLYKLELSTNTLTKLSSSYYSFCGVDTVEHYAFVRMNKGCYIIDLNNGSFEAFEMCGSTGSWRFSISEIGQYTILAPDGTSASPHSVLYYDKTNDSYGYIYKKAGFNYFVSAAVKNNTLYVMTRIMLYAFDLNTSLDNYISSISINGEMSNLEKGIFYSTIGTVSEGKLYVRSYLQADGTFKKEFVVIKNS